MSENADNVIDLGVRRRTPGNPPGPLYRTLRVRAGYHIVVSLALAFVANDIRVYNLSITSRIS